VDCLAESLRESDLGCHIHGVYFCCLLYADNIILLSASIGNLEKMLDLCYVHGSALDIGFNAKKSSLFVTGKCCSLTVESLKIGNDDVMWHNDLKYLGHLFQSGKVLKPVFDVSMRRLYAAANSTHCNSRFSSEMSKLYLMESFCLPLHSYGCDVVNSSIQQLNQLNVCWNNVYRKIFRMHQFESVREIQWFCDRLDLKHIVDKRKLQFFSCAAKSRNSVLQVCYGLCRHSQKYISLCLKYSVHVGSCSVRSICSAVVNNFVDSVVKVPGAC